MRPPASMSAVIFFFSMSGFESCAEPWRILMWHVLDALSLSSAMAVLISPSIAALITVSRELHPSFSRTLASSTRPALHKAGRKSYLTRRQRMSTRGPRRRHGAWREWQETCRGELREAWKLLAAIKDGRDGDSQKEELSVTIMQSCCPKCKYFGWPTGRALDCSGAL